jgi:hypothetical protein
MSAPPDLKTLQASPDVPKPQLQDKVGITVPVKNGSDASKAQAAALIAGLKQTLAEKALMSDIKGYSERPDGLLPTTNAAPSDDAVQRLLGFDGVVKDGPVPTKAGLVYLAKEAAKNAVVNTKDAILYWNLVRGECNLPRFERLAALSPATNASGGGEGVTRGGEDHPWRRGVTHPVALIVIPHPFFFQ